MATKCQGFLHFLSIAYWEVLLCLWAEIGFPHFVMQMIDYIILTFNLL